MNYRELGKKLLGVLTICCIIFLVYGILKVNYNLPEVVRNYSGFEVTIDENPSKLNVKAGDYTIGFSAKHFQNFYHGTKVIINSIKNLIER